MAFSWNPALEIGVREIDAQHRELFRRVDTLVEAMARRQGPAELSPLFDFLGAYVLEHFGAEEALMRSNAYPNRAEHEAEHRRFTEEFEALRREYHQEGATALVMVRVNARVSRWLVEHVTRMDRLIGEHLRTQPPT